MRKERSLAETGMNDETIQRQTLIGFGAAAALLMLVSVIAIFAIRGYAQSTRWIAHSYEVIGELEGLSAALSSAEAARRGFLATGASFYLEERDAAVSRLQSHLQSAKLETADNPSQQIRLRDLERLLAQRGAQVDDLIITAQTEGLTAGQRALSAQHVRQATLSADAQIDTLESIEHNLLIARTAADSRSSKQLIAALTALLLTVAAILSWMCVRIRREMMQRAAQAAELHRANTGLEAANRELESFSYSVSHDLRSPLRAIDGYAQMLEEDYGEKLDATGLRYIHTVRGGSQRMSALIDDLLTFSRLSRQSLSRQSVDMTSLARRVAAELLDGQADPKASVEIPDLPAAVGDPALLRQVWTNLIGNAIKYSSKSDSPAVKVRASRDGAAVRYEVEDNGVGFDMKYANKLFGVFQRLHSLEEYPGTGVGLAIVQRIVVRHDGVVSAHGERGKGATFGFTLPIGVAS
jgi:signal transduction histidine kinase